MGGWHIGQAPGPTQPSWGWGHLHSCHPDPKAGPQPRQNPAGQWGLSLGQGSGAELQLEEHGVSLYCSCTVYLRCQVFVLVF